MNHTKQWKRVEPQFLFKHLKHERNFKQKWGWIILNLISTKPAQNLKE